MAYSLREAVRYAFARNLGFTKRSALARNILALFILVSFLLAAPSATYSATSLVKVPTGSARFLAFPSTDPGVHLIQSWYYEANSLKDNYCSYSYNVSGYGRHCATDYSKRGSTGNVTFPVTAAAAGYAYRTSNAYNILTVEHDQKDPLGRKFCTRYVHLDTSRNVIPINTKVRVKQGQVIGWAGKTGTSKIHLHLDVLVGGCSGSRVDPYDIAAGKLNRHIAPVMAYYPGGSKFAGCGPYPLWKSCTR